MSCFTSKRSEIPRCVLLMPSSFQSFDSIFVQRIQAIKGDPLPIEYDDTWVSSRTPLAILGEYKQKRRWKLPFSFTHTGHNVGPFLVTLTIPDLRMSLPHLGTNIWSLTQPKVSNSLRLNLRSSSGLPNSKRRCWRCITYMTHLKYVGL